MSDPNQVYLTPPPSGPGIKIPILFGAVIALVAANIYLYLQLDTVRTDIAKMRESILTEVANLRETSSVTTQTNRRHLDSLRDELEAARRQASMAVGQAKADADKRAEEIQKRFEAEQKKVQAQVNTQITEVKEAASATSSKLGEVTSEVGAVKSEIASTKSELDRTISDLKRVTGDLGVTSSLVATNGKEIMALKALGERNIFEFKLGKTKAPQKVGDITVLLKKTDPKKNTYTIEVVADDKRVEKKDKAVNEPLQFLVARARQPYEIVVNEVKKDEITGYLATPKVQAARN